MQNKKYLYNGICAVFIFVYILIFREKKNGLVASNTDNTKEAKKLPEAIIIGVSKCGIHTIKIFYIIVIPHL